VANPGGAPASLLRCIGCLPPDRAVEVVRQVCAGLAAAHDRSVLHRDLKPANVMLDGGGKVRITDFGLASFVDDDRSGEIAGTPAYKAPEQLVAGRPSPQTDLYAVGLLLFELTRPAPVLIPEARVLASASMWIIHKTIFLLRAIRIARAEASPSIAASNAAVVVKIGRHRSATCDT